MALRRAYAPADRLAAGTLVVVAVTGLALVAVVERSLLEGPVDGERTARAGLGTPDVRNPPAPAARTRRAEPAAPPIDTLDRQVRDLTLAQRGPAARRAYGDPGEQPRLGATRFSLDRTWAFGTTAIPVPPQRAAMPQVSLFLAHWTNGRWRLALAGSPEFAAMLARVPERMMPPSERRVLARYSAAVAPRPAGLMLPWRVGDSWTMTAGGEGARPLGVPAFHGGDGRVLAAADGRLYRFCGATPGRGLVMVIHDNGVASLYYQLAKVTRVPDGAPVERGDLLGETGVDRPCGGAPADRPRVLFALRHGTDDVPVGGAALGGWRFRERALPPMGWAERGDEQVLPGDPLTNHGPAEPPAPAGDDEDPTPPTTQDRRPDSGEPAQ